MVMKVEQPEKIPVSIGMTMELGEWEAMGKQIEGLYHERHVPWPLSTLLTEVRKCSAILRKEVIPG
jgi:hypothetical protein